MGFQMGIQGGYAKSVAFIFQILILVFGLTTLVFSMLYDNRWDIDILITLNVLMITTVITMIVLIVMNVQGKADIVIKFEIIFCITVAIILSGVSSYSLLLNPFMNRQKLKVLQAFEFLTVTIVYFLAVFRIILK